MGLQTHVMRTMKGVQLLKPHLKTILILFAVVRIIQGVLVGICVWNPTDSSTCVVSNVLHVIVLLFFGGIFLAAQFYGFKLLKRLHALVARNHTAQNIERKLKKLTWFIMLETSTLILFLFVWALRKTMLSKTKTEQPEVYFGIKAL